MIREAPRIATDRLILRSFAGPDYRPYIDILAEPAVCEHLGGKSLDDEEAMRRLCMYAGFWLIQGVGMWAVEDAATGRLVGQVGLFNIHRALDPPPAEPFEMGWIFATECHGRGYAREACDAALDWIASEAGAVSLFAIIALDNRPSMKLAGRLGFERGPNVTYKEQPTSCWHRPGGLPAAAAAAPTATA